MMCGCKLGICLLVCPGFSLFPSEAVHVLGLPFVLVLSAHSLELLFFSHLFQRQFGVSRAAGAQFPAPFPCGFAHDELRVNFFLSVELLTALVAFSGPYFIEICMR